VKTVSPARQPAHQKKALRLNRIKYYSLFENMLDSFAYYKILVDKDKRPVDVVFLDSNKAFEISTGLKREDIINKKITEVMPDILNSKPDLISTFGKVALTGESAKFDFYFERLEKWYSVSVYSPQTGYFAARYEDITERKLTDRKYRRYRGYLMELLKENTNDLLKINGELEKEVADRKLAEAEVMRASQLAALGELAAGVAHEINNPVNGIINYAQILANKSIPGSKEQDIAIRIRKESYRIANIVMSLLSFACDNKEKKRPVHIHEIMSDTLDLSRPQLKKDGIRLNIKIPQNLPQIIAQPQHIEQVFLNIISNARYALNSKYPAAHENKIIEIRAEEKIIAGRPYIRIIIYDRGIGIPSGALDNIMDPFFTTKPAGEGTGLGLSISLGIIHDHGGRMKIDSVEGADTEVVIELPVKTE